MFREIKGYNGTYTIDKNGVVKSMPRKKGPVNVKKTMTLKHDTNSSGYSRVTLCKDKKCRRFFVHRLVYETFIGPIPEGYQIHHKDHNPKNNHLSNLELTTVWENNYYSAHRKGYKLDVKDVLEIRESDLSTKELAEKYGVIPRQILRIKNYDRWNIETSQYRAKPIWEGVETNCRVDDRLPLEAQGIPRG